MKSILLVLLILALALGVFWLMRTEPPDANGDAITPGAGIVVTEPTSVELERAEESGARSTVTESSSRQPTSAVVGEPADPDPMQCGSIHGVARVRFARSSRPAVGKLSLTRESPDWNVDGIPTGRARNLRPVGSLELGPDGEFDVSQLAFGTWIIGCHVPGCAPAQARIELTPENPRARADFDLQEQRVLRITLHDVDGRPLVANLSGAGSKVGGFLAAFVCSSEPSMGAKPCANGGSIAYRARVVGQGKSDPWCTVEIADRTLVWAGVAIGDRTLAYHDVQPGEEDVVLVVSSAAVRSAMGSARITVVDDGSSLPLDKVRVGIRRATGQTDSSGQVRFDELLPGEATVHAQSKDYVSGSCTVSVSPGTIVEAVIRLEPAVTISGKLKSESGRVSGTVRIIPMSPGRARVPDASLGANGTFVVKGLPHGEYLLVDSRSSFVGAAASSVDKTALPKGVVYVDARASSVSNVIVPAELESAKTRGDQY